MSEPLCPRCKTIRAETIRELDKIYNAYCETKVNEVIRFWENKLKDALRNKNDNHSQMD